MKKEEKETIEQMKVFSSPLRRDIFKTIAQGNISFTSLREVLSLTDGRLFFHLKKLDSYIEKDQQNFYCLTEKGKVAYNSLFQSHHYNHLLTNEQTQKGITEDTSHFKEETNSLDKQDTSFLDKILKPDFYFYLFGTKTRSLLELHIVLILIAWLFAISDTHFSTFETIIPGSIFINFILSLFHWYFYFLIFIVVLKLLKIKFDSLLVGIAVLTGLIPYILYLLPIATIFYLKLALSLFWETIILILFIVVKVFSLVVMSQGVRIASYCKFYQAFLISLSLVFVDYIYLVVSL